jgi:hypothetical protein
MPANPATVEVFVDPSCPFAWITAQWLHELEHCDRIKLSMHLLSLAVVNEQRDLDDWYRGFNNAAWAPARVMIAVDRNHGNLAARQFYEAFAHRFHVEHHTNDDADRVALAAAALNDSGLPAELIIAANNTTLDDQLRSVTNAALEPVGLDVGVPVTVIDGIAASGPVLSRVPRGQEAVALFNAIRTLANQDGFIRFERKRMGPLNTST